MNALLQTRNHHWDAILIAVRQHNAGRYAERDRTLTSYEIGTLILQVILGGIGVATLVLYYRQLRVMSSQLSAMQESAKAAAALSIVSFLQSPDAREHRRVVRATLSSKPLAQWSDVERSSAAFVVANYDVVGALIREGVCPAGIIIENWGPSIRHCHGILSPFVAQQRALPGGSPSYWKHFDWLFSRAEAMRS